MNETNTNLLVKAINYAADKHRQQFRKGMHATPYINHPLKVMHELTKHGITETTILVAAVLHDVVEDTEITEEDLSDEFGETIAAIVSEISDDQTLKTTVKKQLQIKNATGLSTRAKLIRIADKICNLNDIIHYPPIWNTKRKMAYYNWAKLVVDNCRGVHALLEEKFDRVHDEGMVYLHSLKSSSEPSD